MFAGMENYIFDLDGTLIDTAPRILTCLHSILQRENVYIPPQLISKELIGPPLSEIIQKLAPRKDEAEINKMITLFREEYDADPCCETEIFAEIKDFIEDLYAAHKKIFVATNKLKVATHLLLKHHFPFTFTDVYTPDYKSSETMSKFEMVDEIIKKYGLNTTRTVFVGDCKSDCEAAKKANIKFCFAEYGYERDKGGLRSLADYIIREEK